MFDKSIAQERARRKGEGDTVTCVGLGPCALSIGEMLADSYLQSPIEIMRFTLIYDGPLPAQTAHDGRVEYKHQIRRQFHSQLLELWQTHPALSRNYNEFLALSPEERAATGIGSDDESLLVYRNQALHGPRHDNIIVQLTRRNFNFVPLVTKKFWLVCELDILFLRMEKPGSLFTTNHAGDLDNRLKVLFDALRVPKEDRELPSGAQPDPDEDPMFCLLENDDLITTVRLESERLYAGTIKHPQDWVRLVVKVIVKAQQLAWSTIDIANG